MEKEISHEPWEKNQQWGKSQISPMKKTFMKVQEN
jgi:hypothetical protein